MHQGQSFALQQILAPQLQQSLQILQAPALELRNLVQQEIEINPVLEEVAPEKEQTDETEAPDDFEREFEQLARLDDEWREYMAQTNAYSSRSQEDEERRQHFFDSITNPTTLQQHLVEQLRLNTESVEDLKLAELVIGNIDENGFLQSSPEEMSANTGVSVAEFQRLLAIIQTLHPSGIGARDLRETLLIQLRALGRSESLEYKIIDRFMDLLGRRKFPEIARKLGIDVAEIQEAANAVATLDPRPGRIFSPGGQMYVSPDVTVENLGGVWVATLNSEQIPHLRISNTYKDLMAQGSNGADVKDYIREKIRSGKFLIRSIHQRQQTILNIANEIVKRQSEFFEQGPAFLKPLTMSQVADVVGVHETTVSRALSGKYIATPHGLYEMKYFFTSGYQMADGVSVSNTSVKDAVAELVRDENSSSPLSDKEIVAILTEKGIPIARRTVAKYRTELNILPSNMRKQY